jgi:dipicolinate synthase subunit B
MERKTVGFAMCGSFCTFERVLAQLERLCGQYDVVPILSEVSYETDSRFGPRRGFIDRIESLCGREIVHTIPAAEPIGPKKLLDALVIAPCTGNTLAKLAAGVADTPVTLACKAHLRNERPVIVAVSTNDGLAANAKSIGMLLDRRHYYFVPFGQDDPKGKPRSLVAKMDLLPETVALALEGQQIQPILQ